MIKRLFNLPDTRLSVLVRRLLLLIKFFAVPLIGLLIFSGCSKNNGKTGGSGGNGNTDSTKPAYTADLSGTYSSETGTWAKAIRVQTDGKILVLGYQWFVRLEKDGVTVDQTFKPVSDISSSALVNSMELQDDGKILVFGKFTLSGGQKGIVRLNADGSLDNSFNNPVLDINYQEQAIEIHAVKLLANGKMVIAGAFSYKTPASFGNGIARLNADQSLDYSFVSPISSGDVYNVTSMLSLSDGGFLLTGYGAITLNDGINYAVVKINSEGVQDKSYSFDSGGVLKVASLIGGDMKELSGGKVLLSWLPVYPQETASHVARLNADGTVDGSFNKFDIGGDIQALLVLPDNSIFVANNPNPNLPYQKECLAHLAEDGKEDTVSILKLADLSSAFCLANLDATTVLIGGGMYYNNQKYALIRLKKNS